MVAGGGRVVSRGVGHDPEEIAALARREVDDGEEAALVGGLAQEHQLISGRHGLTYAGTGRQGQRRGRGLAAAPAAAVRSRARWTSSKAKRAVPTTSTTPPATTAALR